MSFTLLFEDKGAFYDTATAYSFWVLLSELLLHLSTYHWDVSMVCECVRVCVYVCVSLYVLWILQRAHLVAMCQCHWPLCSPSGWYRHSASSDSCSIRRPSRTRDTQTSSPHTHKHQKAWSLIKLQCVYWDTHTHTHTHTYTQTHNAYTERENGFHYSHKLCIF